VLPCSQFIAFESKSPTLPEPYNPLADPDKKEALDAISIANSIIDEVVNKLLNAATEKILREE
jgi:hypothetical protein